MAETRRKAAAPAACSWRRRGVFVTVAGAHGRPPAASGQCQRWAPAMGWLLVFVVVGSVVAAVMCLVCRKRRSSARLNSEDNWQAQWSQVSSTTPAGGAVELHQVGVRNPMADDREKGFSDVNLGVSERFVS